MGIPEIRRSSGNVHDVGAPQLQQHVVNKQLFWQSRKASVEREWAGQERGGPRQLQWERDIHRMSSGLGEESPAAADQVVKLPVDARWGVGHWVQADPRGEWQGQVPSVETRARPCKRKLEVAGYKGRCSRHASRSATRSLCSKQALSDYA